MLSKGVRVAVLDVREPDEGAREWIEGRGDLWWGVCDVADEDRVREMAGRIESEVCVCFFPPFLVHDLCPIFREDVRDYV